MALGAQERWEEAEEDLRQIISAARDMSYPYAEARGLYEWGQLHLQRREDQQAWRKLERALSIFERLGATPYVERTKALTT